MPDQNSEDPSCSTKRYGPRRDVFRYYHHIDIALQGKEITRGEAFSLFRYYFKTGIEG